MMFRTTFSKGRPSFSYIAMRNAGSMIPSMRNMAPVPPMAPRVSKIHGDAHQPAGAKANELPLGEVKRQLGLDPG